MKKLLAVLVIALVVAAGVFVVLRMQLARRVATVPALLPQTTLVLVEVPDPQQTRTDWRESDLYKIWTEPAVQEFLQKPLAQLPKEGHQRTLDTFLALSPKHVFLALTSLERNEPKLIGGFHFDATTEKAREFIAAREAELFPKNAERESISYGQHTIEKVAVAQFVFVSTYEKQWYFASNDVAALQRLLDRADHRGDKAGASLQEHALFEKATKHLPSSYSGMLFLYPRPFVEKLLPIVALTGQSLATEQLQRLGQVESIAAAVGFDEGEMRETDFVMMPRVGAEQKLQSPLLGTAGNSTFFYSDSRIHWSDKLLASAAPAAVGLPAIVQRFTAGMQARGISPEDLRQAFGEELEIAGDWKPDAHWPTLTLSLPVHDAARAKKITEALTSVDIDGTPWVQTEKDGAKFYSAQPFGGLVPFQPTIAISDKFLCAGSDLEPVERTLTRISQPPRELEKSALFHEASLRVSKPESAFSYIDTRLLYERLDGAVRPLLLMGATISPALGQRVDVAKIPPPEVIGKHLSPIVMSQRYQDDGYVTESIGPVTFREATIGLVGAMAGLFIYFQEGLAHFGGLPGAMVNPTSTPAVSPDPTPSPSPF